MNDTYERCRSLYRAARASESSSEADRHAVRKALAAAVTAGITATTAGISGATVAASGGYGAAAPAVGASGLFHVLMGGKVLGSVLIGVALGTALSTTWFVAVPALQSDAAPAAHQERSHRRLAAAPASAVRPPQSVEQAGSPVSQLTQQREIMNDVAAAPSALAHLPARSRASGATQFVPSSSTTGDRLAEEAQALAEVQEALSHKDASLAWTLLQEQNRRFPSGQLGEERAAAKVMALCAASRYSEVGLAQREFARTYPNSPLARRVKKGCEQ